MANILYDRDGFYWTEKPEGRWVFEDNLSNFGLSREILEGIWGPLTTEPLTPTEEKSEEPTMTVNNTFYTSPEADQLERIATALEGILEALQPKRLYYRAVTDD